MAPAASQRCHTMSKASGSVPLQLPSFSVSVEPSCAVPESAGATVLAGGSGMTAVVGEELAVAWPATLVPVTCTRTEWPMSAAARS